MELQNNKETNIEEIPNLIEASIETAKQDIEQKLGISYNEFEELDVEEQQKLIEEYHEHPLTYDEQVRIDGIPINNPKVQLHEYKSYDLEPIPSVTSEDAAIDHRNFSESATWEGSTMKKITEHSKRDEIRGTVATKNCPKVIGYDHGNFSDSMRAINNFNESIRAARKVSEEKEEPKSYMGLENGYPTKIDDRYFITREEIDSGIIDNIADSKPKKMIKKLIRKFIK